MQERWVGVVGRPTTLNGTELRTRPCPDVKLAYLYATTPHMFEGRGRQLGMGWGGLGTHGMRGGRVGALGSHGDARKARGVGWVGVGYNAQRNVDSSGVLLAGWQLGLTRRVRRRLSSVLS